MKYLNRFIICTILISIVIGLFYKIDRDRYFIGKSYFDYKLLPYGLRPEFHCHPYKVGNRMKYEFQIVANEFESYGEGTGCYYDSNCENSFTIKKITGYYFGDNSFIAVCYDTNNKLHYIAPYDKGKGNDVVFINTNVTEKAFRKLKYIQAPTPIATEDYYANYNLWKRIILWIKL